MSNNSIWKVVASAALALICIVMVQGYWLKNTFDYSRQSFDEKVQISLRNVAKQISELQQVQLPSYDLINQVAQDYYIVNIRDAIDAQSLEYYLQKEFEAVGLSTDFEYGIYDCDTDQMVYGNYISAQAARGVPDMVGSLSVPSQNDYVYYFGVRFPTQKSYIFSSQWLPILFTAILLLAVLFFSYATFEILRQKKMSDLQKDFINNMTHEFKTPLSSIQVSAEVFLNDQTVINSPRLLRYGKIIKEQSIRLNDQVERVLQIADLQKGAIILNKQILALDDLVTIVIGQVRGRAEREEAEIEAHYLGTDFMIRADRHHLSNVLYNLTDNSLKYRKGPVAISIIVEEGASKLILTVQDNGIGIDQIYLHKLDRKFFRVPTGNVHNTKGFGLGLHYVKQIVKAHEWTMTIDSQIDQGTQIRITIPKSN